MNKKTKKILIISIIVALALILGVLIFGNKKHGIKNIFKGDFTIKCKRDTIYYGTEYNNKLTSYVLIEGKFNKNDYLTWSKMSNVEVSANEEIYRKRKDSAKKLSQDESVKVEFDDMKRKIVSSRETTVDFDNLSLDKKRELEAQNYIENLENMGYVCEIEGRTRKELGLK